jgi:hypothetical protein
VHRSLGPAAVEWLDRTVRSEEASRVWVPVSRTTNAVYAACVVDLYLILGVGLLHLTPHERPTPLISALVSTSFKQVCV